MTRPEVLVRLVAVAATGLYAALLWAAGVKLDSTTRVLVSLIPFVFSLLLILWDLVVWRLPVVHRATRRPRLDGFWAVTLKPTAESRIPEGGDRGPIEGYLLVTQTYWSLHLRQLTKESGSTSRAVAWESQPGAEVDHLLFAYENDPRPEHLKRSPRHHGTCRLAVTSRLPTSIEGTYFTDRYTQGSMRLELLDRSKSYASFADAREADPRERPAV